MLTTAGSGPRESVLFAFYASGAGPLLRIVKQKAGGIMKTQRFRSGRWWLSVVFWVLAVVLIAEAAIRAAWTDVAPNLTKDVDPKYLAATEHFWGNVFLGIILFAVGLCMRRNHSEHERA